MSPKPLPLELGFFEPWYPLLSIDGLLDESFDESFDELLPKPSL